MRLWYNYCMWCVKHPVIAKDSTLYCLDSVLGMYAVQLQDNGARVGSWGEKCMQAAKAKHVQVESDDNHNRYIRKVYVSSDGDIPTHYINPGLVAPIKR